MKCFKIKGQRVVIYQDPEKSKLFGVYVSGEFIGEAKTVAIGLIMASKWLNYLLY